MINGLGSSYGNLYNYRNTIDHSRLYTALMKNPKIQDYVKQYESASAVTNTEAKTSSLDFLKDYNSNVSGVMQAANSLRTVNSGGVMNSLSATSSDSNVANVTQNYGLRQPKDITLDVSQLATSQVNSSNAVASDAVAGQDMNFSISTASGRSFDINVKATDSNGIAKTNDMMLRNAATAINSSDSGVQAVVSQSNGNSVLTLQSKETGTTSAFKVSGQLSAAEGIQNVANVANDAKYTVTTDGRSQSYTSQNNSVPLDAGRLQADLKGTGSTVVSVAANNEKIVSAVSDLVNSYNKATSFLTDNVDRGKGVSAQLETLQRALPSDTTMKRLGLSVDTEGQLVLNKEVLSKSLKEDPSFTKDLLSGSNGLAQNMFNRSVNAMGANSATLINNDLQTMTGNRISDPTQYMNFNTRSGSYLMNNYAALGVMMNYLV